MSTTHTTGPAAVPDTPVPDTPVSDTSVRRSPAATIAIAGTGFFALSTLVAGVLTGGGPNIIAGSFALIPLLATVGFLRSARWAPIATVVTVLLTLILRMAGVSFDLVRPADPIPFAVAVLTVLSAGISLTSALLVSMERRSEQPGLRRTAVGITVGVILGAVTGLGMVLISPQTDDAGSLTATEIEALPRVEMVNFRFEPGQLRVEEGQPVAFRFNNDTEEAHSFAIEALGIDLTVPSGRSRTVVIDVEAGEYPFVCTVGSHQEDGMVGRLIVEGEGRTQADDGTHQDHSEHGHGAGHDH